MCSPSRIPLIHVGAVETLGEDFTEVAVQQHANFGVEIENGVQGVCFPNLKGTQTVRRDGGGARSIAH